MDENFGLRRHFVPGINPPRTKQLPRRPRKALREDERSCSCARKGSRHLALPKRTAGWQFAVNSSSRKVLAASEHKATESHGDKSSLLQGLCANPQFVPDVVIHDDACHLQAYVRKHHLDSFRNVKHYIHYIVDAFHRRNHKCCKQKLTVPQKRCCNRVRTNMSENFNAWIRPLIFFGLTAMHSGLRKPVDSITQIWLPCPPSRPDCAGTSQCQSSHDEEACRNSQAAEQP